MMRNKSESLLVPRRTCMWNAPDPPFNWPEAYASWGLSAKLPLSLRELAGGAIVFGSFLRFGAVAQLGEHHVCNVGVAGSSPVGSSDPRRILSTKGTKFTKEFLRKFFVNFVYFVYFVDNFFVGFGGYFHFSWAPGSPCSG